MSLNLFCSRRAERHGVASHFMLSSIVFAPVCSRGPHSSHSPLVEQDFVLLASYASLLRHPYISVHLDRFRLSLSVDTLFSSQRSYLNAHPMNGTRYNLYEVNEWS
jgi:hypothetical protein